jgi:hypothetical protein
MSNALLRCSQAYEHIRVQPQALDVSFLHIPSGGYVDRDDREARLREEREDSIKRRTDGGLKGETEDGVENDIRGTQGRAKRFDVIGGRQNRYFHVVALGLQTLRWDWIKP